MWIPICLSILGLLLIYLEFFLPGGLIAILGSFSLVAGVTYFSTFEVAFAYKILYFMGTALGAAFACQLAIWIIKSRKNHELMLSSNQEGFVASELDLSLIGEEGHTASDLKPSGHILVGEKRFQALSEGGYIKKETPIIIIKGQGAHYIVKEKS